MTEHTIAAATNGRTLFQQSVASVGMTFVAFICAMSGLFYGFGEHPQWILTLYIGEFGLLTFPYFFSRESSVEEPPNSDRSNNTQFFSLVVFVLLVGLAVAAIKWWDAPKEQIYGTASGWYADGLIGLMILALVPFIYLAIRSYWLLKTSAKSARLERLFKNKVLLPAFATCLVSFSFGWSASHPTLAFTCMLIPIALIVILKELSVGQQISTLSMVFVILTILLFAFAAVSIFKSEIGKVVIIGVILTLAMGVAEVCKRVVRFPHKSFVDKSGPPGEDYLFYFGGSNWSSIVFPLLLCFFPLLISELPILPIFVVLSVQYLHWHYFFPNKRGKLLSAINVILGFLLPIVLCLEYIFPSRSSLFSEAFGDLAGFVGMAIAVVGLAAGFIFGERVTKFLNDIFKQETYQDYDNCYLLFLSFTSSIAIVIVIFANILEAAFGIHGIKLKSTEIIVYLILLAIIASFLYKTRRDLMIRAPDSKFKATQNAEAGFERRMLRLRFFEFLLLVWNVGRLPVGLIAGFLVAGLSVAHGAPSWLALLQMLPITLTTMAGFVFNDIFDLEKDRIAQREKPLAIGLVSLDAARIFSFLLVIIALVLGAILARGTSYYIVAFTLIGVIAYSIVAYRLPMLKGVVTAILCCAPFFYAAEIADVSFPVHFYSFLLTFIFGRELLLDVRDYPGDRRARIRTLVAYLTPSLSRTVGWTLMFGSVLIVCLNASGISQMMFIGALCSLAFCLWLYSRNETLGLGWSRLTLLIGVIAVSFST